ncbi:MAG: heme exporter protein CcmD [Gammaproteobacteria bacterium]|nr:heme exporter protein CcmD [Gammaproteobacteria bacterium]MBQ0838992.1 heme exporter protein CcmD [Gammaproteobacteria bacterium]
MFQFENFDAFIAMGGHGPYVWGAYGISLAVMAWLALAPLRRQRALLVDLRTQLLRTQQQAQRRRGESQ